MDGSKPKSKKSDTAGKAHLRELRSSLDWLKARGDLVETDKQVDPDLEVTGLQKLMDGGCPVLFNNVKGKPNHRVVTNLFGDMQAINRMFGWESDKARTVALAKAINNPRRRKLRRARRPARRW
jgi:4-hydroxy-3-polyprenylbenzoate decarboxylase